LAESLTISTVEDERGIGFVVPFVEYKLEAVNSIILVDSTLVAYCNLAEELANAAV